MNKKSGGIDVSLNGTVDSEGISDTLNSKLIHSSVDNREEVLTDVSENGKEKEECMQDRVQEETEIDKGSSKKVQKDVECDLEQSKSKKSFVDVIGKDVAESDNKLTDIPTEIDSNGIKIVVFDDVMITEGSKK
ncbi:hypothetical protein Tco_0541350 [Tanacetum coccineum]